MPGYPPYRMKALEAAEYCGMSKTSFLRAVANGEFPPGYKSTGGVYWKRADLERSIDAAERMNSIEEFRKAI